MDTEEVQVFYEIAMSIGSELDHRKMLKNSVGTYLRKLNLAAACVLRQSSLSRDGQLQLEPFFLLPKHQKANSAARYAEEAFAEGFTVSSLEAFREVLPMSIEERDDQTAYLFDLPGFGAMVLVKAGEPLSETVKRSLIVINNKLAVALEACLQNEQLAESRARLELANRELEGLDEDKLAFIRFLSHELHTPLNWIGALHMLEDEGMTLHNRECVGYAKEGFTRLSRFAKQAISYFELARSKERLPASQLRVKTVMDELAKGLADKIEEKGILLDWSGCEDVSVRANHSVLLEVLSALLLNAIGFSSRGGTVSLEAKPSHGGVEIEVRDFGVGIEPEQKDRIFKACHVEECERLSGGYGFSLPRARILCERYGWNLRVESEGKGHGAVFRIWIPSSA